MKHKIVSADEAVAIIQDGDVICTAGFAGSGVPEQLLMALEKRYLNDSAPNGLTLMFAASQGKEGEHGLNRLCHPGLLKRVVGGDWGSVHKLAQLASDGKIEAYNLPQGCISQLYRDIAGGKKGTISKVGLHTFVDPRIAGGKLNDKTKSDIVKLLAIEGEEWLYFAGKPINVALLKGSTADPAGNITMENDALTLDTLAMAMAAKNSGGCVLVQVEQIAKSGSLSPRAVKVPGILVDAVVISAAKHPIRIDSKQCTPAFAAGIQAPRSSLASLQLDANQIIARRAAFELEVNGIVNLGIGIPEGVATVASEEGIADLVTLTTEPGTIGSVCAGGLDFGAAANPDAIIDRSQQFDFYAGGGLDVAFLEMAECDRVGNVSNPGSTLSGSGGFINISQNARKIVFMGTFMSAALNVMARDGVLTILNEGKTSRIVSDVAQMSFSGSYAATRQRPVLYITERCVFDLTPRGLRLLEIAPGTEIEKDILSHMDFTPIIDNPITMNDAIFQLSRMELLKRLVTMNIADRICYDQERNILFLNFERLLIHTKDDANRVHRAVTKVCEVVGHRVNVVVNEENSHISKPLAAIFARNNKDLEEKYYLKISRYTTSAFSRLQLGKRNHRGLASHIFSAREKAHQSSFSRRPPRTDNCIHHTFSTGKI